MMQLVIRVEDKETAVEVENMPAADRYLARFAEARNWFYGRHRIDARNWAGKFTRRNSADAEASFTIAKRDGRYCAHSWCEAHISGGRHSANCPNFEGE